MDPTFTMLERVLAAAGQQLQASARPLPDRPSLARLADAYDPQGRGTKIAWTRLRGFLDWLALHPDQIEDAIAAPPARTGTVLDALLAGIAEKVATDSRITPPRWARGVAPLAQPWTTPGTPRMIAEVAWLLDQGDQGQAELVVVGGSFMALKGFRVGTADIDTVSRIDTGVAAAVEAVATRRALRPDWLNNHAATFAPSAVTSEECEVLFNHERLVVLGPPADFIFLMKLQAARALDFDDMISVWPSCSFDTSPQAVAASYEAYPQGMIDPHLPDFVGDIAASSTAGACTT